MCRTCGIKCRAPRRKHVVDQRTSSQCRPHLCRQHHNAWRAVVGGATLSEGAIHGRRQVSQGVGGGGGAKGRPILAISPSVTENMHSALRWPSVFPTRADLCTTYCHQPVFSPRAVFPLFVPVVPHPSHRSLAHTTPCDTRVSLTLCYQLRRLDWEAHKRGAALNPLPCSPRFPAVVRLAVRRPGQCMPH